MTTLTTPTRRSRLAFVPAAVTAAVTPPPAPVADPPDADDSLPPGVIERHTCQGHREFQLALGLMALTADVLQSVGRRHTPACRCPICRRSAERDSETAAVLEGLPGAAWMLRTAVEWLESYSIVIPRKLDGETFGDDLRELADLSDYADSLPDLCPDPA